MKTIHICIDEKDTSTGRTMSINHYMTYEMFKAINKQVLWDIVNNLDYKLEKEKSEERKKELPLP